MVKARARSLNFPYYIIILAFTLFMFLCKKYIVLSLKCDFFFFSSRYTSPVQCWTHALPWSFRASKSCKVHGSGRRGQIRRCSIVCSSPQSRVASPSSYPHLCMRDLHLPVAVLRRLRHSQKGHASLEPDGRDSLGSRMSLCGAF